MAWRNLNEDVLAVEASESLTSFELILGTPSE